MPDPIQFTNTTSRYELPLLFAAQAQKEMFINEAFTLIDALLHCSIAGTANTPPEAPAAGDCWIIGQTPSQGWESHTGELAIWFSGGWTYAKPNNGMRAFDRNTGQFLVFRNGWQIAAAPIKPTGGSTVDNEARAAIDQLVGALRTAGVLSSV